MTITGVLTNPNLLFEMSDTSPKSELQTRILLDATSVVAWFQP